MKLTKNFNVRWHETNANREMTPSSVLTLMQETTNLHMRQMYPCLEDSISVYRSYRSWTVSILAIQVIQWKSQ